METYCTILRNTAQYFTSIHFGFPSSNLVCKTQENGDLLRSQPEKVSKSQPATDNECQPRINQLCWLNYTIQKKRTGDFDPQL